MLEVTVVVIAVVEQIVATDAAIQSRINWSCKDFRSLHIYLLEVLVLVVSDASIKEDESYMKR